VSIFIEQCLIFADLCLIFAAKFFSFLGLFDQNLEEFWSQKLV
jgi:hypothetical protein